MMFKEIHDRRMMALASVICFLAWGVTACTDNRLTPEEQASLAAQGYYEHLARGEYDAYLEGVSGVAESPADYRQQLRIGVEQYMERVNRQCQGISSVEISSVQADSLLHCVNVFLTLCFGDSTREEICVPMVEKNGTFQMR